MDAKPVPLPTRSRFVKLFSRFLLRVPDLYQALRGVQRMSEVGEENGPKIGQQFSAVRKALDSTYLRMTVCFMAQELEAKLAPDEEQKADLSVIMKDLEALLARIG